MRPLCIQESSRDLHGDKRPGSSKTPLLWVSVDRNTQHLLVETPPPAPTWKVLGHMSAHRGSCQGGLTLPSRPPTPQTQKGPHVSGFKKCQQRTPLAAQWWSPPASAGRRHEFEPCSRKIPQPAEQPSPCTTAPETVLWRPEPQLLKPKCPGASAQQQGKSLQREATHCN